MTETRSPHSAQRRVLAATVHDPDAHFLAGLHRLATSLRDAFAGFGVLATTETASTVVSFLESELGAKVSRAPSDETHIGRHRRESVRLAAGLDPSIVLYSDLDHVLRWIEADRAELEQHLTALPGDFVVIGRTDRAMRACPRRLRETEAIVNHLHRLGTGRDWDLMFASRAMSGAAAEAIVDHSTEDSIANDVEWPLLAEQLGFEVGYRPADGLAYRITQDFDTGTDRHDSDLLAWIYRVELAHLHAQTLKRMLGH